jgi:hypothetical protein
VSKKIHAEIQINGSKPIHSDVCPPDCEWRNIDDNYRKFLHLVLDEYLDNSNGTGYFYIGTIDLVEDIKSGVTALNSDVKGGKD